MPTYTIYVSSTYRDLIPVRSAVIQALRQAQYTVVSMETYPPAFDQNIKEKCEKDVGNADIYLGIIGDSYGSLAVDTGGQQLSISYTEYEYNAAVNSGRKMLIFFKHAESPVTDQNLLRFKERIRSRKGSGLGAFEDTNELSTLVLASLSAATGVYQKKAFSSNEKYYCDRIPQMTRFNILYRQGSQASVLLFLLTGRMENSHDSFVKRYKMDFVSSAAPDDPWELDVNVGAVFGTVDVAGLVEHITGNIGLEVWMKQRIDLADISAGGLLKVMNTAGVGTCIINLILQGSSARNRDFVELFKSGLERFWRAFLTGAENAAAVGKIVFFVQFRYSDTGGKSQPISKLEDWPFLKEKRLELTNVRSDDVDFWLEQRNIEENAYVRRSLVLAYFAHLESPGAGRKKMDEGFFMDQAKLEMEKIIDLYNNRIKPANDV